MRMLAAAVRDGIGCALVIGIPVGAVYVIGYMVETLSGAIT